MLTGVPPPDFPGGQGEVGFEDRGGVSDVQSEEGRIAMGLVPVPERGLQGMQATVAEKVNQALGFA